MCVESVMNKGANFSVKWRQSLITYTYYTQDSPVFILCTFFEGVQATVSPENGKQSQVSGKDQEWNCVWDPFFF